MPHQNLHEAALMFLTAKNFIFFGVGVVVQKIKSDPKWTMVATLIGTLGVLIVPTFTVVGGVNAHMEKQIVLHLKPLVESIDSLKKKDDERDHDIQSHLEPIKTRMRLIEDFHLNISDVIALSLKPLLIEIASMKKFHDYGNRYSKEDSERDFDRIDQQFRDLKTETRLKCMEVTERVKWLEQMVNGNGK